MKSPIKVGNDFTFGMLHQFAAEHRGNIKGRMGKDGVLEIYSSRHGAGLNPVRTMRKQQLATAALHKALCNSFGENTAIAVFKAIKEEHNWDGGYLTHDIIAKAEFEARTIASQRAQAKKGLPRQATDAPDIARPRSESSASDLFGPAPDLNDD